MQPASDKLGCNTEVSLYRRARRARGTRARVVPGPSDRPGGRNSAGSLSGFFATESGTQCYLLPNQGHKSPPARLVAPLPAALLRRST
eukprot:21130-Hanusia_phi.AAC.1